MRRTIFALAALSILAGCAVIVVPDGDGGMQYKSAFGSNAVDGNGQQATESREVSTLDGIDVNGPMQVEIRVGQAPSLQVEGDSNILPLLRTDASSGTLRIWIDGSVRTSHPLRITYTTPELRQVSANGSGNMHISGLHGGPLSLSLNGSRAVRLDGNVSRLDARLNGSGGLNAGGLESGSTVARLSGSGQLALGRVNGELLNLEVQGSGGASASGNVRSMTVRLNGSGSADLAGLTSQSAELNTNGSGSISAAVTQSLVASANGSGSVTVYGNPSQRSISGKRVSVVQ
ncbi:Putative auto-transporter adhesin, head GIN domain [Duganella sacchari]|uniref:Putative auto-transporter adhesin, head GIN domain n=1 Tax=Duganella sacchari TaxID=551987 RepID=A0A1M7QX92_9BURK|nr:head GIN domain-containing protein [Duganella sacchari]SHN36704.1 Putative auto-transporter adhesin, head GIN domain [Duganella sacchari]